MNLIIAGVFYWIGFGLALTAFAMLGVLLWAIGSTPAGYEDESGYHDEDQ